MFNPYIGLCKFVMALLVVAIHVEPFTGDVAFYYNHCLARIADPMFFSLSAYFLFEKLLVSHWNSNVFFKQIRKLCAYYGVWLIVYAPVIISRTWTRTNSVNEFIWQIFRQIFLSGPYGALWFLPALILGLTLTYWIGKHTTPLFVLILSCPFFLLSVVQMEYFYLIKDIAWLTAVNDFFISIFGWLGNGINYGWFFCAMGLYLASQKEKLLSIHTETNCNKHWFSKNVLCFTIAFVALVLECTLIRHYSLGISYGAMLMLIPTSYYLLLVLLQLPEAMKNSTNHLASNIRIWDKQAKYLQDLSLLIFPLHYGIMDLFQYLLRDVSWYSTSTTLQYITVIAITCMISGILLYLGKRIRFFRIFYGR